LQQAVIEQQLATLIAGDTGDLEETGVELMVRENIELKTRLVRVDLWCGLWVCFTAVLFVYSSCPTLNDVIHVVRLSLRVGN
jgi:uncharacterized membrane protein YqjE